MLLLLANCTSIDAPAIQQQATQQQATQRAAQQPSEGSGKSPVVVIGLDGLEWSVMEPLLNEGKLPHLKTLIDRGQAGKLRTLVPTRSPVIWTTIATGKMPAKHGIDHFVRQEGDSMRLLTNADRHTKALWNITTDHKRTTNVVWWWMTWPVDPIQGTMVAQTNTIDNFDTAYGKNPFLGSLVEGIPNQVHPSEKTKAVMDMFHGIDASLQSQATNRLGPFPHAMAPLEKRLFDTALWAFRGDLTTRTLALELAEKPFDLMMVYFGGADVACHHFWRYYKPDQFVSPPTPNAVANLGEIVPRYYMFLDQVVGELVEAVPAANFVVVSDHGTGPANTDFAWDSNTIPANIHSAGHENGEPGVLIAAGPGISPKHNPDRHQLAAVPDIAPLVLSLMGLPVGADMDGASPTGLLTPEVLSAIPPPVKTHDTPGFGQRHDVTQAQPGTDERMEQLKALGYLE